MKDYSPDIKRPDSFKFKKRTYRIPGGRTELTRGGMNKTTSVSRSWTFITVIDACADGPKTCAEIMRENPDLRNANTVYNYLLRGAELGYLERVRTGEFNFVGQPVHTYRRIREIVNRTSTKRR